MKRSRNMLDRELVEVAARAKAGLPPLYGAGPAAVIGRQVPMVTVPNGATFLLAETQLIAQRLAPTPRQWVVTLQQPAKVSAGQPWQSTFDGTSPGYPPAGGTIFTAPGAISTLMCRLQWGGGGVTFSTVFRYPPAGAAFGLTAEQLQLDVFPFTPTGTTAEDVPVIGAFMVEGVAADPSPLRWYEDAQAINAAAIRSWAIKPYARKVRIASPQRTQMTITWRAVDNTVVWQTVIAAGAAIGDYVLDVPTLAAVMQIVNDGAAPIGVFVEWFIGLT